MRSINIHKKSRIVRLFLQGLSYDDIVGQTGVSKGAVVNIVSDFREGRFRVPPDMGEYVDALRQAAVDLRKNSTTVDQLKSYLKIHAKLKQMGVLPEQAEEWLEVCQDIASPVANNVFVNAALELAQLKAKSKMGYRDVVVDYKAKADALKNLGERISQGKTDIEKQKLEIEQATAQLASINKAVADGEQNLSRQKEKFKSQERAYLARRNLTEQKVKLVKAAMDSGFKGSGLSSEEAESIRRQIISIGSLAKAIEHKEKQRDELKSQVDGLNAQRQYYYKVVGDFESRIQKLEASIAQREKDTEELEAELLSTAGEINKKVEDLYLAHIIIDFLLEPGNITNSDFDRLVEAMIVFRQKRLGLKPEHVVYKDGKVLCQYRLPVITTDLDPYELNIDNIREKFAYNLAPLLRDKLVSRLEFDLTKIEHQTMEKLAELKGIVEERQRNQQRGILG